MPSSRVDTDSALVKLTFGFVHCQYFTLALPKHLHINKLVQNNFVKNFVCLFDFFQRTVIVKERIDHLNQTLCVKRVSIYLCILL